MSKSISFAIALASLVALATSAHAADGLFAREREAYTNAPALTDVIRYTVTLPQVDRFATAAIEAGLPVDVYAVNTFETRDDGWRARASAFWTTSGVELKTLSDPNDELAAALGIDGLPLTLVIDADGVIRARHSRSSEDLGVALQRDVANLLRADR